MLQKKQKKRTKAGLFGKLLGFLTGDNLFIYIKIWYPMKQKVYSEFFLGTKKVYDLYDSYGLFQTIEGNKV